VERLLISLVSREYFSWRWIDLCFILEFKNSTHAH